MVTRYRVLPRLDSRYIPASSPLGVYRPPRLFRDRERVLDKACDAWKQGALSFSGLRRYGLWSSEALVMVPSSILGTRVFSSYPSFL